MRLGFHYHIPAELRNSSIWMPGYLGRFVDSLGLLCAKVVCFMHSPHQNQREFLDYQIQSDRVHLIDIGRHCSVYRRTLQEGKFTEPLNYWTGKLDALLVRGPSPLLPAFCISASRINIPTALLLVGSYVDGVDDLPQPLWRKEMIRFWAYWNQWRQLNVAKRSLTLVNSRKLFKALDGKVPSLIETRTTTLRDHDFFEREDTCGDRPIRILYTGRFDRAKGLFEVIEALAQLISRGHDAVIDLVGWHVPGDNIMTELMNFAGHLGVGDRVFNHGLKTVGPELFEYYRKADIYVLASKGSEGFPRTIWEAMAHSLPVVATRVGSIPEFLGDAAELVTSASVSAITNAVEVLITTPARRRQMILKGRELARQNTLELRCEQLIGHIGDWIGHRI